MKGGEGGEKKWSEDAMILQKIFNVLFALSIGESLLVLGNNFLPW